LLLDLKRRGLDLRPELAIADGALGFWKAAGEIWPTTREQRCWVHKTANVLAKLPKSQQPKAKRALQEIWMAETKAGAEAAFDAFIESYRTKYDKAAECLNKDRDPLLTFYDFPAEHWKHLRTTNPIESTFATVRHRTIRRRAAYRIAPHPPWSSSSSKPRRKVGGASMATTSCQNWFSEPIAKLPSDNWDCGNSRLAMIARRVFCKPALDQGAVDAMHWQFLDAVRLCGVSSVSN